MRRANVSYTLAPGENITTALKMFGKLCDRSGLSRAIKHNDGPLYAHWPKAQRARVKSLRARARARKLAAWREKWGGDRRG